MEETEKRRLIIRIGRNTLSFAMPDPANKEQPISYAPYIVKGGISMAANLRAALKTALPDTADTQRIQVLLDSPSMLVPLEQFDEATINDLYDYSFPACQEPRKVLFNVIPDLKAVALFAISKDMWGVLNDRFGEVQYILATVPVWRRLHQRSFTGHRNKLYGYFHGSQLDLFSFQQNRFKYCNTFDAAHVHDALYYLLYIWKQLRMDATHDELHLAGDIPEKDWLTTELKQYLQKTYIINPSADYNLSTAIKAADIPYDLLTHAYHYRNL